MRKGFIFTIDSVMAIAIVLLLVLVFGSMQQTEKGKEKNFTITDKNSSDKAMTQSYFPATGGNESLTPTKEQGQCKAIVRYNPNDSPGNQSVPSVQQVCEEM